jgi:hypothetical protein
MHVGVVDLLRLSVRIVAAAAGEAGIPMIPLICREPLGIELGPDRQRCRSPGGKIGRRMHFEGGAAFQVAGPCRLMSHTMKHRSAHTLKAIEKLALVVLGVTEINDSESDQNR